MNAYKIIREGFYFRAINTETGWRSVMVTSASQAVLIVWRKAGKAAAEAAKDVFLANA